MNFIARVWAGGFPQGWSPPFTIYTQEYHMAKRETYVFFFNLIEKAEGSRSIYLASLWGKENFLCVQMIGQAKK